jgi:hypothetical protein
MADVKKAGLLGAALVGGLSAAASAQDFMTQEEIGELVASMQSGGNSGGGVSVGGGGGGGTVASGNVTGGGDMQIGGDEGLAVADASGGNHNVSFVS